MTFHKIEIPPVPRLTQKLTNSELRREVYKLYSGAQVFSMGEALNKEISNKYILMIQDISETLKEFESVVLGLEHDLENGKNVKLVVNTKGSQIGLVEQLIHKNSNGRFNILKRKSKVILKINRGQK